MRRGKEGEGKRGKEKGGFTHKGFGSGARKGVICLVAVLGKDDRESAEHRARARGKAVGEVNPGEKIGPNSF